MGAQVSIEYETTVDIRLYMTNLIHVAGQNKTPAAISLRMQVLRPTRAQIQALYWHTRQPSERHCLVSSHNLPYSYQGAYSHFARSIGTRHLRDPGDSWTWLVKTDTKYRYNGCCSDRTYQVLFLNRAIFLYCKQACSKALRSAVSYLLANLAASQVRAKRYKEPVRPLQLI